MKKTNAIVSFLLALVITLCGCTAVNDTNVNTDIPGIEQQTEVGYQKTETQKTETNSSEESTQTQETLSGSFDIKSIPAYSGKAYIAVNDNNPYFTESDLTTKSFEKYAPLDSLGRCGVAYANVGIDIMPTEKRGSIGMVKPSGWHSIKYENVDGKYLYNRCHLIGYQLSAENANTSNLITGTRYLNIQGMLRFENMVADYVKETKNHVLYRVTPIFEGNNLLASGVLMEGYSVEDDGAGICYNVYCYNVQPGIKINYATGDSEAEDGSAPYGSSAVVTKPSTQTNNSPRTTYIGNKNTKKFHYPDCSSVDQMKDSNKVYLTGTRDQAIQQGYDSCGRCCP